MGASFIIIFGLLFSIPEVLLFITNPFPPQLGLFVNEVTFGKHLRLGELVAGESTINRGLDLSVPPPDFWGGERLSQSPMTSGLINHAYVMKPP